MHFGSKKGEVKNLYLNENDYTALAMKLVIYKHPKSKEILEEQLIRISNPDRAKRFSWLLPSLALFLQLACFRTN